MKNLYLVLALAAVLLPQKALATHSYGRNASRLTVGLLPNERLDPSSVTLLGPGAIFPGTVLLTATQTLSGMNTFLSTNSFNGQVMITSSIYLASQVSLGAEGLPSRLRIVAKDDGTESALSIRQYNTGLHGFGFDWMIDDVTNGDAYIMGVNTAISTPMLTMSNRNVGRYFGMGLPVGVVPSAILHLRAGNDASNPPLRIDIDALQASVGAADTFIDFRSQTGSEGTIAGTGVAGVIAYNTFTGSHYTQIDDKSGMQILYLVEGTGEPLDSFPDKTMTRALSIEEIKDGYKGKGTRQGSKVTETVKSEASPKGQLTKARLCETRKSASAWGFWIGTDAEGRDMIASIGTGYAYVANKGKNIAIGDYLMSSDVAGHVELQLDDSLHNYTVAKAREAIIWQPGETFRKIAVTYHGG